VPARRDPTRYSEALSRGLSALVAVNAAPPVTIAHVMTATGLPKATVMRLLSTLRSEGHLEKAATGFGFAPSPKVRLLSSAMALRKPVVSAVSALLVERVQVTKWPLEFLVPDGDWMTIQVTTRGEAPISLRRVEQTRFPVLTSASGVAYLSALDAALARASAERAPGGDAIDGEFIRCNVGHARQDGFATHDDFLPVEGSRLLAVPAMGAEGPAGCLAMAYPKEAVPHSHVVGTLVPALKAIAADIGAVIRRYGCETG